MDGKVDRELRRARIDWSLLSEQQLLETTFEISCPETLEGITEQEPPDYDVSIEYIYRLNGRKQGKLRCVYCKWNNHYKGYVVIHRSGSRHLVGKDCGLTRFGISWQDDIRAFEAARERSSYLRRREAILGARSQVLSGIAELASAKCLSEYEDVRRQFRLAMPESFRALVAAASSDRKLFIEERVRDRAKEDSIKAERRNLTTTQRKKLGHIKPQYRYELILIGFLNGAGLFERGPSPRALIEEARDKAQTSLTKLEQTGLSAVQIRNISKQLEAAAEKLNIAIRKLNDLPIFFEIDNLRMIAKWANNRSNSSDSVNYVAEIGALRRKDPFGERVVRYPSGYQIPRAAFLETLLGALRVS